MYLEDEYVELSEWPARGKFSRRHVIRAGVAVFRGCVSLDIREWCEDAAGELQPTKKGIQLSLAEAELVRLALDGYHETLRKLKLDKMGLRANGTNPRALNKAPRQRVKQREAAVAHSEAAVALKERALAALERARGENVIDLRPTFAAQGEAA